MTIRIPLFSILIFSACNSNNQKGSAQVDTTTSNSPKKRDYTKLIALLKSDIDSIDTKGQKVLYILTNYDCEECTIYIPKWNERIRNSGTKVDLFGLYFHKQNAPFLYQTLIDTTTSVKWKRTYQIEVFNELVAQSEYPVGPYAIVLIDGKINRICKVSLDQF